MLRNRKSNQNTSIPQHTTVSKQPANSASNHQRSYEQTVFHVSFVSLLVNTILTLLKLIAGLIAHSGAMVSDAIHSASDVFSTIVVMIGVRISGKPSDDEHPYGHERLECVASIILAAVLCFTGIQLAINAIRNISASSSEMPGMLALIAAAASIIIKELMFRYTMHYAKQINSVALMADAWHHRSDAFSSIGAFAGIGMARLGVPYADAIASIVICLFIVKAAYDIFKDAVGKMVDSSCSEKEEQAFRTYILEQPGVLQIDRLTTRTFSSKIYIDLEIGVQPELSLMQAHDISEQVHDAIEKKFPDVKHIMIHVNPANASPAY